MLLYIKRLLTQETSSTFLIERAIIKNVCMSQLHKYHPTQFINHHLLNSKVFIFKIHYLLWSQFSLILCYFMNIYMIKVIYLVTFQYVNHAWKHQKTSNTNNEYSWSKEPKWLFFLCGKLKLCDSVRSECYRYWVKLFTQVNLLVIMSASWLKFHVPYINFVTSDNSLIDTKKKKKILNEPDFIDGVWLRSKIVNAAHNYIPIIY